MLLEVIQQDKFLTAVLVITGTIWLYVLFRNIRTNAKSNTQFQTEYERVLNNDESKVKGRFEQ
jgi:hypothetical protein